MIMKEKFSREELKEFVPHREPMLLIDEIEIDDQGVVHAKYRIRSDEFFLQGHFPNNPLVPGVILCEIMAQSCSMLIKNDIKGRTTLFRGMDNVVFRQRVMPEQTCEVTARLLGIRGPIYLCRTELSVEGVVCSKADMSFVLA